MFFRDLINRLFTQSTATLSSEELNEVEKQFRVERGRNDFAWALNQQRVAGVFELQYQSFLLVCRLMRRCLDLCLIENHFKPAKMILNMATFVLELRKIIFSKDSYRFVNIFCSKISSLPICRSEDLMFRHSTEPSTIVMNLLPLYSVTMQFGNQRSSGKKPISVFRFSISPVSNDLDNLQVEMHNASKLLQDRSVKWKELAEDQQMQLIMTDIALQLSQLCSFAFLMLETGVEVEDALKFVHRMVALHEIEEEHWDSLKATIEGMNVELNSKRQELEERRREVQKEAWQLTNRTEEQNLNFQLSVLQRTQQDATPLDPVDPLSVHLETSETEQLFKGDDEFIQGADPLHWETSLLQTKQMPVKKKPFWKRKPKPIQTPPPPIRGQSKEEWLKLQHEAWRSSTSRRAKILQNETNGPTRRVVSNLQEDEDEKKEDLLDLLISPSLRSDRSPILPSSPTSLSSGTPQSYRFHKRLHVADERIFDEYLVHINGETDSPLAGGSVASASVSGSFVD